MARDTITSMAFFSPRAMAQIVSPAENKLTTTLFVTNLHCASCVTHTQDTLRPIQGIYNVDVNLLSNTICIQHDTGLASTITDVLVDAAFEVQHVTTSDATGQVVANEDLSQKQSHASTLGTFSLLMSKSQRKHIANCKACQSSRASQGLFTRFLDGAVRKRKRSTPAAVVDLETGVVTSQLGEKTATTDANAENTDTANQNATASEQGQNSSAEAGRAEASATSDYVATISIVGMTCASCTTAITNELSSIDFVNDVQVTLLSNTATVTYHGTKDDALKLTEAVEDVGFEASIQKLDCMSVTTNEEKEITTRTVEWEIDGMYCPRCPENIKMKLDAAFKNELNTLVLPTLKVPRLTVKYMPTSPCLTVRRIKYVIESADPAIIASIYHPPTLEERSQTVQRQESNRILRHLLFALAAAIPSFVIGIVYMSLVSSSNPTRVWFEQPMWAGQAMRIDWAMFFITTLVMFYSAGIFHTRALKEIWALWRPKSKVPVLRRLYRFGSMNLLLSAGTSVAYFSSLAILIMEAATPTKAASAHSNAGKGRHSITYFDTVTFLTLFILCGKFLQAYSKSKTGDAVAMLGKLRPTEALLVDDHVQSYEQDVKSTIRSVAVDLLEIGDIVSIPHGGSPPTDGIIDQDGTFLFNESSLTGESKPVKKARGDKVLTGSVLCSDSVRMVVRELGGSSMLDQIINVVRSGQAKRAPVERFADVVTSYFTPVITFIAILTWVIWLALGESGVLPKNWLDVDQGGWAFWSVEFAIAVFVVACPCGLGLAAPTALFVGGGLAAKAGILVQGGGEAFQEASKLDVIVFDKTRTLTEGQMRVTGMKMLQQDDTQIGAELVLGIANALEEVCTHPIAKAISTFCQGKLSGSTTRIPATDVKEVPGQGMQGVFEVETDGQTTKYEAAIGNERQLHSLNSPSDNESNEKSAMESGAINSILASTLFNFQSSGCSTAILSIRRLTDSKDRIPPFTPTAIFAITDPIRAEAPSVLSNLRSQNIEIHMCTGDNPATAQAIASQLSIPVSNIRAGVLPQDKASYIHSLQTPQSSSRKIVAFCGDGTNDTLALQAADVSIALSSGSDIALTSASFILLNSNLESIEHLVGLSKRVFRRVKLNFAWAAVYNVALIPVAAGVFFPISQWRLSPVWAAAAMAGSSVSVVLSSLALRVPWL